MTLLIRDATTADAATVVDFNSLLAEESEGRIIDRALLGPGVRAILGDAHRGRYFLALSAGEAIGQLCITYEWSDWRNGWFWWFQSVYIRPESRRAGVFSALYAHVLQQARGRDDVCGLRLYVHDDNRRAQSVYAARGMSYAGYRVMELDLRTPETGETP